MAFDAEDGSPVGMERTRGKDTRVYRTLGFFFNSFLPITPKPHLFTVAFARSNPARSLRERYSYYATPVSMRDKDLFGTTDWVTTAFSESDNDWS